MQKSEMTLCFRATIAVTALLLASAGCSDNESDGKTWRHEGDSVQDHVHGDSPMTAGDTYMGGGDAYTPPALGTPIVDEISETTQASSGASNQAYLHFSSAGEPMLVTQRETMSGIIAQLATRSGTTWTVDNIGSLYAFAVDGSDNVHKVQSFLNTSTMIREFKHAVRVDGSWTSIAVDQTASPAVQSIDMAIGSDGRVHIVYMDTVLAPSSVALGGLKYAVSNDTGFTVEVVEKPADNDTVTSFGEDVRLVLAAGDQVRVVYVKEDDSGRTMRYGVRTGVNAWTLEDIATDTALGFSTKIGLDASENPTFVCASIANGGGIYWIRKVAGTWVEDRIRPDSGKFYNLLAADFAADGKPHTLAYADYQFYYIRPSAGTFEESALFSGTTMAALADLVLDDQEMPHIALSAVPGGHARYIHY